MSIDTDRVVLEPSASRILSESANQLGLDVGSLLTLAVYSILDDTSQQVAAKDILVSLRSEDLNHGLDLIEYRQQVASLGFQGLVGIRLDEPELDDQPIPFLRNLSGAEFGEGSLTTLYGATRGLWRIGGNGQYLVPLRSGIPLGGVVFTKLVWSEPDTDRRRFCTAGEAWHDGKVFSIEGPDVLEHIRDLTESESVFLNFVTSTPLRMPKSASNRVVNL